MRIDNVNEMMTAAAEACEQRDVDKLDELEGVVQGWLQDDESYEAQLAMLNAMRELVYLAKDYEEVESR